jgi:DNA-directed RNA polymerase subunit RPC12/RpoP
MQLQCAECNAQFDGETAMAGMSLPCPKCGQVAMMMRAGTGGPATGGAPSSGGPKPPPNLSLPDSALAGLEGVICPSCTFKIESGAVICTNCGYDIRTGKGLRTTSGGRKLVPQIVDSLWKLVFALIAGPALGYGLFLLLPILGDIAEPGADGNRSFIASFFKVFRSVVWFVIFYGVPLAGFMFSMQVITDGIAGRRTAKENKEVYYGGIGAIFISLLGLACAGGFLYALWMVYGGTLEFTKLD